MAVSYANNQIVTDGLVLALDAGNHRSYPGSGTTWYDLSGHGNHATLYNSPTFNKGVFTLDGTNDYIRTTNTLDLTSTNAVTILLFFKPLIYGTSLKVIYELSSNYNNRSDSFVATYSDNSTGENYEVFADIKGNSGYNIAVYNKTLLNDLNWHQHTIIHDTSQTSTENLIYSNGTLATPIANPKTDLDSNNTNNFGNQYFYIASRGGSTFFCNIDLGQITIYNRALSATEILQNYNATKTRFGL